MSAIQTATNLETPVVARQDLYEKAGVPRDAICPDSGATAAEIEELWGECDGDEALYNQRFNELAEANGASGQCSGNCIKILDALKAK